MTLFLKEIAALISEALYSLYFESEMFKKLLHQVLEKLKEQSPTLKQKL